MANALSHSQTQISAKEYIEGEKLSEIRHEYVGGYVYAMAGASDEHNRIGVNLLGELRERLRGKRCEPFGADMKLKLPGSTAFYYPDAMVTCDPADNAKFFRERPTVVFEVLSPETERTDQREKMFAYALIDSLRVYVIISQEKPELTVLRRAKPGPWLAKTISGIGSVLELPEIKIQVPLLRIYERTKSAKSRP